MLCIQWEEKSIRVALVNHQGAAPVVLEHWNLVFSDGSLFDADEDTVTRWLRQAWINNQIPGNRAFVAVPRRHLATKSFSLPSMRSNDFSEAARLKAESLFSTGGDQILIDFVPLPSQPDRDDIVVLSGAVNRAAVERMKRILQSASLVMDGLCIAELGMRSLYHSDNLEQVELQLLAEQSGIHVAAFFMGVPFLSQSHSMQWGKADRADWANKIIEHSVSKILSLGYSAPSRLMVLENAPTIQVRESIENAARSSCPEANVSHVELTDSGYLLGLASSLRNPATTLNFLSPRMPPDRGLIWRTIAMRAACVLVIFALLLGWVLKRVHSDLDLEITRLNEKRNALSERLAKTDETLIAAGAIGGWNDARVQWSTEFRALISHAGNNERCYMDRIQLETSTDSSNATARLIGFTREKDDALEIADRLIRDPRAYEVSPGPIQPSRNDPYYQTNFDLRVEWIPSSFEEQSDVAQ